MIFWSYKGGELERENGQAFRHERDRRAGRDRDEDVEHREIEIERRVIGKPMLEVMPNVATPQLTKVRAFKCESMAPLGEPVEPEVKSLRGKVNMGCLLA